MGPSRRRLRLFLLAVLPAVLGACATAGPADHRTDPPGTGDAPREVIVVAHDYLVRPDAGRRRAGRDGALPRPQRRSRGPRGRDRGRGRPGRLGGGRSGDDLGATRADHRWSACRRGSTGCASWSGRRAGRCPLDGPTVPTALIVGCHIPGHWARGMQASIRFVDPVGRFGPSDHGGGRPGWSSPSRAVRGEPAIPLGRSRAGPERGSSETRNQGDDTNDLHDR